LTSIREYLEYGVNGLAGSKEVFGFAFAEKLAAAVVEVFQLGRHQQLQRLGALQHDLNKPYGFCAKFLRQLPERFSQLALCRLSPSLAQLLFSQNRTSTLPVEQG
jgi:hypothetical protein